MTEKRPIDANDLMARFFRKECLMQGHSAAASAAYKDAQKTVAAASTVSLWPEWRNPEANPPKVEEDVLILFETACGGYGITTAHYEDGTVLSEKSAFYWEEIFEWGPTMKKAMITLSLKAGGNIVISTRMTFTITVWILPWLGGCLCRRRG